LKNRYIREIMQILIASKRRADEVVSQVSEEQWFIV
jgi:hypothetical protein